MCDRAAKPTARGMAACFALAIAAVPAIAGAGEPALHDPLRPPGWHEPSPERAIDNFSADAWKLESTLTSNGRRVAIINGRTVRPGDHVDGARVLAVGPKGVRLDYNGRQFRIRRPQVNVRRQGESSQ